MLLKLYNIGGGLCTQCPDESSAHNTLVPAAFDDLADAPDTDDVSAVGFDSVLADNILETDWASFFGAFVCLCTFGVNSNVVPDDGVCFNGGLFSGLLFLVVAVLGSSAGFWAIIVVNYLV